MTTREEWLMAATRLLDEELFSGTGYRVPDAVRVSCGFPSKSALSRKSRRIGECWPAGWSAGRTIEIFISPTIADGPKVMSTLVHELVHACVGCAAGHKGPFVALAKAVGLVAPWTGTTAGEELKTRCAAFLARLGAYPHTVLDFSAAKKQSTRLVRMVCPDCEVEGQPYIVRMSQTTIDQRGAPLCPIHERELVHAE